MENTTPNSNVFREKNIHKISIACGWCYPAKLVQDKNHGGAELGYSYEISDIPIVDEEKEKRIIDRGIFQGLALTESAGTSIVQLYFVLEESSNYYALEVFVP